MKKSNLFLITNILLLLFSCKEELKPQENSEAIHAEQKNSNNNPQKILNQTTNTTSNNNSPSTNNQIQQTQKGLNPAHGQPGHRCDLPVGAPLNSKPNQTNTTNSSTQKMVINPQMITNKTKTAKGMNPPHGQPGHRCDIPVGAPLNSKPQQATPIQTTNSTTKPELTPSNTAPSNPPHGQPGHICINPEEKTEGEK